MRKPMQIRWSNPLVRFTVGWSFLFYLIRENLEDEELTKCTTLFLYFGFICLSFTWRDKPKKPKLTLLSGGKHVK